MARNRSIPESMSTAVPPYEKRRSYDPEQCNNLTSSVKAAGSWGGGSYKSNGRAARVDGGAPGYGGSADMGRHTTADPPPRGTRPGRW